MHTCHLYCCDVYIILWTTDDTCMVRGQFWKIVTDYFLNEADLQVTYKISPCSDNIQKTPAFVNQDLSGLWIACALLHFLQNSHFLQLYLMHKFYRQIILLNMSRVKCQNPCSRIATGNQILFYFCSYNHPVSYSTITHIVCKWPGIC